MSTVTMTDEQPGTRPERRPTGRSVLMCRPEHFTVVYRINPWMNPAQPTDTSLAVQQWQTLYDTYVGLGYDVQLDRPDRRACPTWSTPPTAASSSTASPTARSSPTPSASPRARPTWTGSGRHGFDVREPEEINEGEGDFLLVGETILAGTGLPQRLAVARGARPHLRPRRRDPAARRPELLPPRHRHRRARPHPRAGAHRLPADRVRRGPLAVLQARYPDAIIVNETDAAVLGLNSFSDGFNVVIASRADRLRASVARARLPPDRRRPLRAAARRRRRQVLHPGAAPMTTDDRPHRHGHRTSRTSTPRTTTTRCPSSSHPATAPG